MKKLILVLSLVILLVLLTSCVSTTITTQTTTNAATTTATTERIIETKNVSQYLTYNFSSDITIEEQNFFIKNNEGNIQYLLMRDFNVVNHLEFYISKNSDNIYNEKAKIIFLDIDEYNTPEALFCIIQAFNSRYANYGLIYGMAYYIASELGYEITDLTYSEDEVIEFFRLPENIDYYDITFPCFYIEYSTEEQIHFATEFSRYIVEFIIEENNIFLLDELIKEIDLRIYEEEFIEYKNLWFYSLSNSFQLEGSDYPKAFSAEHIYNTLEWKTESSEYELRKGYFIDLGLEQYSLNQTYEYLVNGIDTMEADMDLADEILKDETYEYPELHIILDPGVRGWYNLTGDLLVGSYGAFLHEYVHYLTMPIMDVYCSGIMYEWVACYYSNYSIFFQESVTNYLLLDYQYNLDQSMLNKFDYYYNETFEYLDDWQKIIDIQLAYYPDYTVLTLDHYQRIPLSSYVLYLINICGSEEAFYEVMKDNSLLENYSSKTFEELVDDWIVYHQEKYVLN